MLDYLILFAIVLGVNLMPAFGPPTWSVIVIYSIDTRMPAPAIVVVAASAAATGRFLLAYAFRLLASHVSEKTKRNVAAARVEFERKKRNLMIALGLFVLSPVPSAPLFEAAGLAKVPLLGFTAGRLFRGTHNFILDLSPHYEKHRKYERRRSVPPCNHQSVRNRNADRHDRSAGWLHPHRLGEAPEQPIQVILHGERRTGSEVVREVWTGR